jgi:hypothetical protein
VESGECGVRQPALPLLSELDQIMSVRAKSVKENDQLPDLPGLRSNAWNIGGNHD